MAVTQPICPGWEWQEDHFVPCEAIPLSDRGFRYGMSLFESILVRNETPLFLHAHLARLAHACERLGFPMNKEALSQVGDVLRQCGVNGFARVYVTAGDGGVSSSLLPRLYIFVEPRAALDSASYEAGYALAIAHRPFTPLFPGMKTGNYWLHIEMLRHARDAGKDEALLLNEENLVVSTCMANVFVVRDGAIRTPALSCGARDGVVREWVGRRRTIDESALTIRDVECADEIFLTNSWIGVMPVQSIEGRTLPSREMGTTLHGEYQAEIAASAR